MDSPHEKMLDEENYSIQSIKNLESLISLSNSQILSLASSSCIILKNMVDKLSEKIEGLNGKGVEAINAHRYSEGLVYLL
jgi:hypothetical protein